MVDEDDDVRVACTRWLLEVRVAVGLRVVGGGCLQDGAQSMGSGEDGPWNGIYRDGRLGDGDRLYGGLLAVCFQGVDLYDAAGEDMSLQNDGRWGDEVEDAD